MLFILTGKGILFNMKPSHVREYQTVRLFAILGLLTLLIVVLFKVVLFAPQETEPQRLPAQKLYGQLEVNPGLIKPLTKR
jgi:hypothetical protein